MSKPSWVKGYRNRLVTIFQPPVTSRPFSIVDLFTALNSEAMDADQRKWFYPD